jgi:hypothetical protein
MNNVEVVRLGRVLEGTLSKPKVNAIDRAMCQLWVGLRAFARRSGSVVRDPDRSGRPDIFGRLGPEGAEPGRHGAVKLVGG